MSSTNYDINILRNIILDSQHLLHRSNDRIERIVSDICGLQYDPNPTIHLNQYMMLWNRKKDFEAERELKERVSAFGGLTLNQIWDNLGLADEWHKYRREHDPNYNLPIFRAFYRMCRRGDFLTCGRNPGTFKEPVYILKEKAGFSDWTNDPVDE